MILARIVLVIFGLSLGACTKKSSEPEMPLTAEQLWQRGESVYKSTCIACHNMDPAKAGSIGPEVMGASLELLQAKILRGEYPAGYSPKRTTNAMTKLPYLEKEIPAVHAYLNSLGKPQ